MARQTKKIAATETAPKKRITKKNTVAAAATNVVAKRGRPNKAEKTPVQQKTSYLQITKSRLAALSPKKVKFDKKTLENVKRYRPSKVVYLGVLVIALALLISYEKSWFVAATVNGSPISNYSLLDRMNKQYRSQTLNQMINEKIIADAAQKQHISITPAEVDARITELEGNVGGPQMLDSLLSQQGQTREDLRSQLEILLMMEKMYANEASVSAAEVNQFITTNKDQLTATDSAGQIKEATNILKQQKLNQIYSQKFQELKQQSQVQIF